MAIRIAADKDQPSATIEIPLEKPLPDYDLNQLEQPTPRDVDAILVSQGFRDLVDDARGILTELLSGSSLELAQFTGAICPGDDETYRPGLWIVLRDKNSAQGRELSSNSRTRISAGQSSPSHQAMPEEKGLLIVYTGPGKGKTTCALGTAFRAAGQGLKVLMVQFIKGSWHYGELDAAKMLGDDKFEIRPMGRGFVKIGGAETDPQDIKLAQECWQAGRDAINSGKYDLVVLDEINYTISYKMLDPDEIVDALKNRPERVHVICTGRNAHAKLVELADLVTEMRDVKHPYTKGILAQRGIDY